MTPPPAQVTRMYTTAHTPSNADKANVSTSPLQSGAVSARGRARVGAPDDTGDTLSTRQPSRTVEMPTDTIAQLGLCARFSTWAYGDTSAQTRPIEDELMRNAPAAIRLLLCPMASGVSS